MVLGSVVALSTGSGCGDTPLGACGAMPDPGGRWTFQLAPLVGDLGVDVRTLDRPAIVHADLSAVKAASTFAFARYLRGTLESEDPSLFGRLTIPVLNNNNGSKTGSTRGCSIAINVPIADPVSDDDIDEGPMRISLFGTISARGMIVGDAERSVVIPVSDATATPRRFAWSGTQP